MAKLQSCKTQSRKSFDVYTRRINLTFEPIIFAALKAKEFNLSPEQIPLLHGYHPLNQRNRHVVRGSSHITSAAGGGGGGMANADYC